MSAKSRAKKSNVETAPGVGTCWLGKAHVFAFGDGRLVIDGKTFRPHDGAIVSVVLGPDGRHVISAGDDGRVVASAPDGTTTVLFDRPGAWLDTLVVNADHKKLAVVCGREVMVIDANGKTQNFKPARAPNALAFDGTGDLLAIGHSGGVSLFQTDSPQAPWYELPCSGGPVSVALSPAGGFLFAGLSEPALAGWRLADGQGFRMGGYPGKPRQLVWSHDGKALLTSGGPALLVWPMVGKDGQTVKGPMGQAAGVYRPRLGLVTAVAAHGDKAIVGWSDGGVDLVHLVQGTFRHISGPRPQATLDNDPRALTTAIISVSFRGDGQHVSWIGETGAYGTALVQ